MLGSLWFDDRFVCHDFCLRFALTVANTPNEHTGYHKWSHVFFTCLSTQDKGRGRTYRRFDVSGSDVVRIKPSTTPRVEPPVQALPSGQSLQPVPSSQSGPREQSGPSGDTEPLVTSQPSSSRERLGPRTRERGGKFKNYWTMRKTWERQGRQSMQQ